MTRDERTVLTVDLGNTNASAALVRVSAGAVLSVRRLTSWAHSSPVTLRDPSEPIAKIERGFGDETVHRCALSAVGGHGVELDLRAELERLGLQVELHPSPGLDLLIDSPETCGFDRQYAMRAALETLRGRSSSGETCHGHAIVVDAGTALTVDAGRIGDQGSLEFLGGSIALGPGELVRSITAAGARLPEFEIDPAVHVPALGRSTTGALRSGAVVGFRGAVRELVHSIASEAFGGLEGVELFLTGGASAFAQPALLGAEGAGHIHEAPLVHEGLAHAALAGGSPR